MRNLKWKKRGLIFSPAGQNGWMNSHAQVPTALCLDDRVRVYFSSRPLKGMSLTTYVDLDINDLSRVLYTHPEPILTLGKSGMFDEHGIMPASVLKHQNEVYLYYSGWQRAVGVPYNNYTGLAISRDEGKHFTKFSRGPIVDRTPDEVYSATSPDVLYDGDKWHMWYCAGTDWIEADNAMEHVYDIKYADSTDGKSWIQSNKTVVPQREALEALTRPTVIKLDGEYHMWFCYRGSKSFRDGEDSYRIGYAHSRDCVKWIREDTLAGIDLSREGWDSKMIAYPCVIKVQEKIVMFYNGNGFGLNGFGYAELSDQ